MKSYSKSIFLKMIVFTIGINLSTFHYQSHADEIKEIIKRFCLESVKNEMVSLTDPIYNEVAEHTCNCFIQRMNNREEISTTREICKKETSIEFSL
jgi:hypothetical protein